VSGRGPVVGVLGGGQLGRMLALAGAPLDVEVRLLDRKPDACAGRIAPLGVAPFEDLDAVRRFARACDVVTMEFESVPLATCEAAASVAPVLPGIQSQRTAQDRARERALFAELGIDAPRWVQARTAEELGGAARDFPLPAFVKRCRGGYDGKGQARLERAAEAPRVFEELSGDAGGGVILDEMIEFDRELSVVAVRARDGRMRSYALAENLHEGGILRRSVAPAPGVARDLDRHACESVRAVAERLDHVGVLAVEFFQRGDRLLANEIAPRVHNTGHWTIEGAETSQFENHLRAVLGLPLGGCGVRGSPGAWAMVNLIGVTPAREAILAHPGARLHLYAKGPKPGRKLGHVTVPVDPAGPRADPALVEVERLARGGT